MKISAKEDIKFMQMAIQQAEFAIKNGEAPIGAVMVYNGEAIAVARNNRECANNPIGHAEMLVIQKASEHLSSWRLTDCTLYVTLEPCPMCAGTIISSRVSRVVYGAKDEQAGCLGSVIDLSKLGFNHTPLITAGVLSDECRALLTLFFQKLRE